MRRKERLHGRFYARLLLSYFLVLILALVGVGGVYYLKTLQNIDAKYRTDFQTRLGGSADLLDGKLLAANNVGAKLALSSVVHSFAIQTVPGTDYSNVDLRGAIMDLDDYNLNLEVSSGLCVVFPRTGTVLSNYGPTDIATYFDYIYRLSPDDSAFILSRLHGYITLEVLPPVVPTVYRGLGRTFIPIVKSIDSGSENPRAYAVFLLDADKLARYVGLGTAGNANLFLAYDGGPTMRIDANPISDEASARILASIADTRPIVSTQDDLRYYFHSKYVNLAYVFRLPRSPYLIDLSEMLVFLLLVTLVVLGTGIPLAVSLLNRSYRPIQHIVTDVFHKDGRAASRMNEIDLIAQEIQRIQQSQAASDGKLKSYEGYVHESLLGGLVKTAVSEPVLDSLLEELDMAAYKGRPANLLVLKPVLGERGPQPRGGMPYLGADAVPEAIEAVKAAGKDLGLDLVAFPCDRGLLAALVFVDDAAAAPTPATEAFDLADRLKTQLLKYMDRTCLVGFSDERCFLGDTVRSYDYARRMVECFAFTGLDGREGIEKFRSYSKFYYDLAVEQQRHLEYSLKKGNRDAALEILDAIRKTNEANDLLSFDAQKRLMLDLADTGMKVAAALRIRIEWADPTYSDFREAMSGRQMWDYVRAFYLALCDEVRARSSGTEEGSLGQLIEYVDRNFTNPALSLKDLSARFHLPDYTISRRFKSTADGSNFLDYLAAKRVLLAKEFLESTDFKIEDIAVKVGFENVITFRRIFKKHEGVSPSEYRDMCRG